MKEDAKRNAWLAVAVILAALLLSLSVTDDQKFEVWFSDQLGGLRESLDWVRYVVFLIICGTALLLLCIVVWSGLIAIDKAVGDLRDRWDPVGQRNRQFNQSVRQLKEAAGLRGFYQQGWYWMELLQEEVKATGSVSRAHQILMADIGSWSDSQDQPPSESSPTEEAIPCRLR